ncbi:DUF1688 family protein [Corticibacter populi]|uniref:DUF1688 family protein n=1 Tax=Corticibacter populi TaxID=1550736 RepID=A0A3M6QPT0_9BURK|nr:DUF1688 family protein [Corticibacter populi]RMX05035.1 DUF1688 family protein [Corticibacter populi]RZS33528.1 uncharacterized protein DUF1688 [Corticibacter populi]
MNDTEETVTPGTTDVPADAGQGWHTPVPAGHAALGLLDAAAVRRHAAALMARIEAGESEHFTWQSERLLPTAQYVAETIRHNYPDLQVPYHSRWRHFEAGGVDRWAALAARAGLQAMEDADRLERARVRIDLVIPSVLLDAGAGPDWRYHDAATGQTLARSEGLGVASLQLFTEGAFSADPARAPLRSDGVALVAITPERIARTFQVGAANPLVGLAGRAELLRRLGEVMQATPAVFGQPARLGHLLDYLLARIPAGSRQIDASEVLRTLLLALGPVWPGRVALDGVSLGDCWVHPGAPQGLMPFHKLTQWLTYSLLEALEDAGLEVTGLDALTGLPEYRNGGLLLDMGLLAARDADFHQRPLRVDDPAVIEWRAATVVALDHIAALVRSELGLSAEAFPLARVLEGGTWSAGRRIAAQKRQGGGPPVSIDSDGTVF